MATRATFCPLTAPNTSIGREIEELFFVWPKARRYRPNRLGSRPKKLQSRDIDWTLKTYTYHYIKNLLCWHDASVLAKSSYKEEIYGCSNKQAIFVR
jgi:hypothetical protein